MLRLLGRFALSLDGTAATQIRLSTRKSGALIAYLAMSPEQTASREALATLLWGADRQARQSLRQALTLLRKELGWSHVFTADADAVRLQPGVWSIDARDFEECSRSTNADDLDRAARLFGGEFLAGLNIDETGFDAWVSNQRQRMQLAASRLCETFAARSDLVTDGEQAVGAIERMLALDPLREDWQRLALTLFVRYRGKSEALAHADAFAALLKRELNVAPEKATLALVEQIRAGEIAPIAAQSMPVQDAAPALSNTDADCADERPPSTGPMIAETGSQIEAATEGARIEMPHVRRSLGVHRWPPRRIAAGIAAVALVGGALGLAYVRAAAPKADASVRVTASPDPWQPPPRASSPAAQLDGIIPLVVLPFRSAGEGSDLSRSVAEVMTDDLTGTLSRTDTLRVISRETARNYRDRPVTAIGAELAVRYVLAGGVEADQGKLRVHATLTDTTGRLVWSARFERTGEDWQAIQDEIIGGVGRELSVALTRIESERDAADLGANHLIIKGWNALLASTSGGQAKLKEAEQFFVAALERAKDSPRAKTGLGAYHVITAVQLLVPDAQAHLAKGEALLQDVIDRHQHLAETHQFIGLAHVARGRADVAATWFERAIALNPSLAPAYAQLGRVLSRNGHPDQALAHILYAMRLSPNDPGLPFWLGFAGAAEIERKNYQKAIEYFDRALALNPTQPRNLLSRVSAHALAGNLALARKQLEQVQTMYPHLSGQKLLTRFFGQTPDERHSPQLRRGLQLALAPPSDFGRSP
jgi:DNA-binding SARP family transcriptional activator/TolB-like protein